MVAGLGVGGAFGLAGCSQTNNADSTQQSTSTNTDTSESSTSSTEAHELAAAYSYTLKAGTTYELQFGHTHEHELKAAFLLNVSEDDLETAGNTALSGTAEEVEQEATIAVSEKKAYAIEMAHLSGKVFITVPSDGTWTLVANCANGDALPYSLHDESGSELEPSLSKVFSDAASQIYKGYFTDEMIKDRTLSDYEGDWKSVYPLLQNGSLDEVMAEKAEHSDGAMTAEEYKAYYEIGYKTDIDSISIHGDTISFTRGSETASGTYKYVGYKVLKYKKGNRGVRFLFEKTSGDDGAPTYVQFSDHNIFPTKASHFHIFMSDESQEAALEELENWPTFYPVDQSTEEIAADMMAHS